MLLFTVTGLDAVMVALPPASTPFGFAVSALPMARPPVLVTQVEPVVDCASIAPTAVVMRLPVWPISVLAIRKVLPEMMVSWLRPLL